MKGKQSYDRAEMRIMRCMCKETLRDRKSCAEWKREVVWGLRVRTSLCTEIGSACEDNRGGQLGQKMHER